MPVRFLLEKVPAQCDGVVEADPFLRPTLQYPKSIPPQEQERLTRAISAAVKDEVLPAYRSFGGFMAAEYAPHGRTVLAVTSLPGGEARYLNDIRSRTTVSTLSPEQIHQIGLSEIRRIEGDMLTIARSQGFADLQSFRESLRTNPKYRPTSARADHRRFSQVHRADAAQAARFVRLHTRLAGDGGSHSGFPGGDGDPLSNRHARRQAPGPRGRRHFELRASLAHRRRSHRLSRGHPRASHAALRGAADDGPARSFASTSGIPGTSRVGRCMPSSSARRSASTRIP